MVTVPTWQEAIESLRRDDASREWYRRGYRDGYEGNPQTPPPFKPSKQPWLFNDHEWYTTGYEHGEDDSDALYWPLAEQLEQEGATNDNHE